MTIHRLILILACLCLTLPSSLSADWQYTRWGMSEEEVISASGEKAVKADSGSTRCKLDAEGVFASLSGKARLRSSYVTDRFNFDVCFYFDDKGGLAGVELLMAKDQLKLSGDLLDSLKQKYGVPYSDSSNQVRTEMNWADEVNNNRITYWSARLAGEVLGTVLIYRPLKIDDGL